MKYATLVAIAGSLAITAPLLAQDMNFDFEGNAPSVQPQFFAFDCDGTVLSETVRWESASSGGNNYRRLGLNAGPRATTGDYAKAMVHIPVASQSFRLTIRTPDDRTSSRPPLLLVRGGTVSNARGWTHRTQDGIFEMLRVDFANGVETSTEVLSQVVATINPPILRVITTSMFTQFVPTLNDGNASFGVATSLLPPGLTQGTGVSIVVGGAAANLSGLPEGSNTNDAFYVSLDDIAIMSLSRGTDCDNSGSPDIFWRNPSTGQTYQWLMNQTTVQGFRPVGTFPGNWRMVGAGNIDNQGASDLVMQDTITGDVRAWLYNADGSLVARRWLGNPGTAWRASAVADFNNDAMSDIVFRNTTTGENALWTITSSGTLQGVGSLPFVGDTAWQIIGACDINYDGLNDLLWSRHGEIVVWRMNPDREPALIDYLGFAPTDWKLIAAGDFDNDGLDNDLMWHNEATGDIGLWGMDQQVLQSWTGVTNIGTATAWQGGN
jgi:hypothetical protein